MAQQPDSRTLSMPMPQSRHLTLGLVLVRRIAGHGLNDARAAMLAMDAGGESFRRVLVLARTLVVDLARASRRRIMLAPCCACGMTRDEGLLVAMIDGGGLDVYGALSDDARCAAPMTTAHALGAELERIAMRNNWRS